MQECFSASALWLRDLQEVVVQLSAGAAAMSGLSSARAGEPFRSHSQGCWKPPLFHDGYWPEASIPCHLGFLLGCFSVFKSWQLASPRTTDEGEGEEEGQGGGEGGKPQSFTILISTVTYYYFHPICWSQRPILVQC